QLSELTAQVRGKRRIRIGDGFAAAHEAAQLARETFIACLHRGIFERRRGIDRPRTLHGQPRGEDQCEDPHRPSPFAARISGTKSRSQISIVIGAICLNSTFPELSIRNVSGAPYTPQSIATRPSTSNPEATYGLPSSRSQRCARSRSSFQFKPTSGTSPRLAISSSASCSCRQPEHHVAHTLSTYILPAKSWLP